MHWTLFFAVALASVAATGANDKDADNTLNSKIVAATANFHDSSRRAVVEAGAAQPGPDSNKSPTMATQVARKADDPLKLDLSRTSPQADDGMAEADKFKKTSSEDATSQKNTESKFLGDVGVERPLTGQTNALEVETDKSKNRPGNSQDEKKTQFEKDGVLKVAPVKDESQQMPDNLKPGDAGSILKDKLSDMTRALRPDGKSPNGAPPRNGPKRPRVGATKEVPKPIDLANDQKLNDVKVVPDDPASRVLNKLKEVEAGTETEADATDEKVIEQDPMKLQKDRKVSAEEKERHSKDSKKEGGIKLSSNIKHHNKLDNNDQQAGRVEDKANEKTAGNTKTQSETPKAPETPKKHHANPSIPAGNLGANPVQSFAMSCVMILLSEIGDKTFLIAALMAMRHPRVTVFTSAWTSLIAMSVLSAVLGHALPSLIPRKLTSLLAAALFVFFGIKLFFEGIAMSSKVGADAELHEVEMELNTKDINARGVLEEGFSPSEKAHRTPRMKLEALDTNTRDHLYMSRKSGAVRSRTLLRKCIEGIENLAALVLSPAWVQIFIMTFLAEWGDRSQIATVAMAAGSDYWYVILGAIVGHGVCTFAAVVCGKLIATRISMRVVTLSGAIGFIFFALAYLLEGLTQN